MFVGSGRRSMLTLVGTGLAQALIGGASALALRRAFHSSSSGTIVATIGLLVVAAFALGSLRLAERVRREGPGALPWGPGAASLRARLGAPADRAA